MEFFWQIGLVLVLVFLNGFFVASEFALVAIRKTRIDELVKRGNASAKLVQTALSNLDTYISATQLGITIASLALGWVGEPVLAHYFEEVFLGIFPPTTAYLTAHGVGVFVSFTIITFLHIVLGELAPKSIALQKAEKTSLMIIAPLSLFASLFKPFIYVLNEAGLLVLKAIGFKAPSGHQIVHSEEEIKLILAQSASEGAIEKEEAEMVYSVLKFADLPVKQIMIPRTSIVAFEVHTPINNVVPIAEKNLHSRFPVFDTTIDSIVGFIHIKEIYKHLFSEAKKKSKRSIEQMRLTDTKLLRKIIQVPESRRIDDVLLDMRKNRVHIAIVKDEYGGTAGVVTLEDIIESLVGEIQDEFEIPHNEIQKKSDGTFLVDGLASIESVRQKFKLPLQGNEYSSIGGLMYGQLGHTPSVGETIQVGEFSFEITEVEQDRIIQIIVKKK